MKRNNDLIRDLMLYIEENNKASMDVKFDTEKLFKNYSNEETSYHIKLLVDSGFIIVLNASSFDGDAFFINRITNSGHDFIDAIREDTVWKKTKEKAGTYSLEIIKDVASSIIKQSLGLA